MAPDDRTSPLSAVTLPPANGTTGHTPAKAAAAALVVGALGVVFGDIGTSPLYTLRESFTHGSGMTPTPRFHPERAPYMRDFSASTFATNGFVML